MKLKVLLKQLPRNELNAMGERWGVAVPDSGESAEFLAAKMQPGHDLSEIIESLPKMQHDALLFLAIHGGVMGEEELRERVFSGARDLYADSMKELATWGFVLPHTDPDFPGALLAIPEQVLKWIDIPVHLKGHCGWLLARMTPAELCEIVAGIPDFPRRARDPLLPFRLRAYLLDPVKLRHHVSTLPPHEQEMFAGILKRRGHCLYRELLDPANTKRFDHVKAEQLNTMIASRGLVFSVLEGHNKYTNLLIVPRDVFQTISSGYVRDMRSLREIDQLAVPTSEYSPKHVFDNASMVLRDLALFAAYVDAQKLRRVGSGGIGKNDLKKALSSVSGSKDSKYLAFLAGFLIANKHLMNVRGVWKVSDAFRDCLKDSFRCYWDLYNWWVETSVWDEASNDRLTPPHGQQTGRSIAFHLRRPLLEAIATVPTGKWISFNAFAEIFVPQIETTFPDSFGKAGPGGLERTLQAVLANILREPLAWLGVVSLGSAEPLFTPEVPVGRAIRAPRRGTTSADFHFQRTPLGNHVLTRIGQDSETANVKDVHEFPPMLRHEGRQFIVQPNLAVVAPPDLSLDSLFLLARFSVIRNVDVVTSFEITRDSVGNGMDRGLGGEEILHFLQESSRMELPQMIHQFIKDCSSKHGEASIGRAGGYIIVDSPLLLQEIRSNPRIGPHVKDVIGDRVLLLSPDADLQKIAREMRQHGLMPQIESESVHATTEDKFHVTLSSEELCDVIAGMRLVGALEEEMKVDITQGKAAEIVQKLRPESPGFQALHRYLDSTSRTYIERFKGALGRIMHEVSDKYKDQVSRLVSRGVRSRTPSKYSFKGANPAVERKDILELLTFAREYELETEIAYVRQNEQEARLLITPKSFEGERLYAYCVSTDSDSMYSLKRIRRAKLI